MCNYYVFVLGNCGLFIVRAPSIPWFWVLNNHIKRAAHSDKLSNLSFRRGHRPASMPITWLDASSTAQWIGNSLKVPLPVIVVAEVAWMQTGQRNWQGRPRSLKKQSAEVSSEAMMDQPKFGYSPTHAYLRLTPLEHFNRRPVKIILLDCGMAPISLRDSI